jgi:pimeloyl-ACP methyl ester carboxylesterase
VPFADNAGVRIHYEVTGRGSPLLLHHWSLATLDSWHDHGYVGPLAGEHRLILMDGRGHGASDKPHEEAAYTFDKRVSDVVAVLDDLGVETTHYLGYSMGGWIAFGVARWAQARMRSLIIGAQHPYERSMADGRELLRLGIERGAGAFAAAWERRSGPLPDAALRRAATYDFCALLAVAQDRADTSDVLPTIRVPCLVYAGEHDAGYPLVARAAAGIAGARLVTLPGLDHMAVIRAAGQVVPHITGFLRAVDARG